MRKVLLFLLVFTTSYAWSQSQIDVPITFEGTTTNYTMTDFGGNVSSVVVDPTDPTNMVGQANKTAGAQLWAGTTMGDIAVNNSGLANALPFSAGNTTMTVRVWSPDANTPIRLKVEDAADPTKSVETEALTTAAATWETLTFDFSNEAAGTSAINFANTYDKASIFFNFGTDGATAGAKTYYWDDVIFVVGPPSQIDVPVTFEGGNVNYTMTDFGGNVSSVVVDPTDPTNMVGQADKTTGAQVWAGTTMGDAAVNNAGLATALPFSAGNTTMTVRVWSPDANTPIRLKVEDASDPTKSVETEALTTTAATWETLTFDFSNEAAGTSPINFATTYDKASIFFNFGTDGATAGAKTYYWDDVTFVTGGGGGSTSPYCNTQVFHLGIPAEIASTIFMTIKNTSATTMEVEIESANADPVDLLIVVNGSGAAISPEDFSTPGKIKRTLTWASPPANVDMNVLWSKASFGGNWQLNPSDISIPFSASCGGTNPTLSQIDVPVTFEGTTVNYTMTDFGGNVSSVVVDPTDPNNMVGQADKTAGAQVWAGTTMGDTSGTGFANALPFSAGNTIMSVRVWSPDANTPIRLKVEDAADPTKSVETEALTTAAATWETLTFDFSNEATGTAAINFATTYDKASIFFNFGTDGATAGAKTYYWDDVIFGAPPLTQIDVPVTFEDSTVNYALTDFGGNVSSVVVDPTDPTNIVAQSDKTVGAQVWAGTTMGDAITNEALATALPFSAGNTVMTVRVWSPDAGTPIRLKVEDAADPTKSVETEALTTAAATWETLVFDFSNEAPGTAAINFATTYNKASIFFNFGTDGATAGAKTYYWDDVNFGAPSSTGNDVCANALPITTNGLYACDSVNSGGTANHAGATNARWFYFDAPSAGTISVDACGTGVDTRLWIMTGTCGATVDEAGDDDGCGPTFESTIQGFPVTNGTRYYIQWDDRWSQDPFDFQFVFNACAAPTAVSVTNLTGTSADINFTSTATTELEWGPAGFVQGTGTLISPATSPVNLTSLTNATTYGFYLRQICAPGDTSLWDGPFSFTTDLAPCAITAAPSASDVDVCIGSTATLTATLNDPNNSAAWYTSVGGPIVSISNPFTTPAINSNTTYYVAEANGTGGVQTHVGPAAPTGALTFPGGNFSNGIWFTVDAPLTLDSMTLVVNGALDGSINISSDAAANGGVLLQSFNYSLPAAGTFQIPVGVTLNTGNYYMNLGAFTGTGVLFRSTAGANYPSYNLPNVVSIDSTNFGGGSAGTRFYYFWDWVVNSGCTGPVDSVNVTAIPTPDADFTFSLNGLTADFTSVVNNPDSVSWDFGDGNVSIQSNPTNIYAAAGTYNVSLTAYLGDCDSTITKAVSPTVGLNKAFSNSVSLYPNPSNGTFIVDAQGLSFDRIEVRDMLGKVVFQSANTFTNRSEITISNIATGNYIVTLINDEGMAIKQLTIK